MHETLPPLCFILAAHGVTPPIMFKDQQLSKQCAVYAYGMHISQPVNVCTHGHKASFIEQLVFPAENLTFRLLLFYQEPRAL